MTRRTDDFFAESARWRDEALRLRGILLDQGLEEELKWGKPCYIHDGQNIAILQKMKAFLALLFFKGALMDDPEGLLREQGKNTRSARRLCFTSVEQVDREEAAIRALIRSAVAVEEAGLELPPAPAPELAEELQARLDADPALKRAFEALTPGRQRAYDLHISGAKRSETRARRVEQHVPRILAGKGLRDP
ncbi:MAG: YdeI/OmpD-associated family protein [Sandaracinaceae bacterium]|nr:hypothetical protein [Myxococcales bacterium]